MGIQWMAGSSFFLLLGLLCMDIEVLRGDNMMITFAMKFGVTFGIIFFSNIFPIALVPFEAFGEKNYSLKSLSEYLDLQYGDYLSFNYHIKTKHSDKKNVKKAPICKIVGEINNGNLSIENMDNCETNIDVTQTYKDLLTSSMDPDGDDDFNKDSKFTDFIFS